MAKSRSQFQIDISPEIRNRAKAVAYGRGLTLTELILLAFTKTGDKELAGLAEQELKDRANRSRSSKK